MLPYIFETANEKTNWPPTHNKQEGNYKSSYMESSLLIQMRHPIFFFRNGSFAPASASIDAHSRIYGLGRHIRKYMQDIKKSWTIMNVIINTYY
jgi:hypothetical protein